ncbi:unnamed protein product [Sympodiomycopsis kandeliae]
MMDHSEHSGMDHGSHQAMCTMNMIWNTDPTNLCLVFPSWQITSTTSLYTSLLIIVLLGIFYEWLRLALRRLDRVILGAEATRRRIKGKRLPSNRTRVAASTSMDSPLSQDSSNGINVAQLFSIPKLTLPRTSQLLRSSGYALSVTLSFFLMLLFMTYNSYVISAVVLGAAIGHYLFQRPESNIEEEQEEEEEDRGMSCH